MLSNKTIRNKSAEDYIELCFEVSRWLEKFNKDGREIFGDDYEVVLAFIGLATVGVGEHINTFVENAEAYAKERNEKKKDILRQFNIKLEGDDTDNKLKN